MHYLPFDAVNSPDHRPATSVTTLRRMSGGWDERLSVSTMWELVSQRAALSGDQPVLIDEFDRVLTFTGLRDRAEQVAAGLLAMGVGPGTPVTWQLPTRIESVVLAIALARLGAVQNPLLHLYGQRELGFCIRQTEAKFVFHPGTWKGTDYAAMVERAAAEHGLTVSAHAAYDNLPTGDPATLPPPPARGDEVRWIYSTSGTTSEPKGVRHTDQALMAGGRGLAIALDLGPDDVGSMVFPFAHIAGPDYLCMMLGGGFPAVIMEAFVPAQAIELFNRHGATIAGGGPAFYLLYLNEQRKQPGTPLIPTLKFLSGGGAPMPPEVFNEVRSEMSCFGAVHGYGMTEIPMIAQGSPHDTDEQLMHTVGKPVQGAIVRIAREDGSDAAAGEDGEVRVKGPIVCQGYLDPVATAEAFDADGWFRTGDVGHLRDDGHLVLTGRIKDIIIRKGENIAAKEIEDLLYAHPKVGDVAVIGVPDRERGEMVVAVVEPPAGSPDHRLTFDEMVAHLRHAGLMTRKIPERLEVIPALPRNETLRKILKYKLREQFG